MPRGFDTTRDISQHVTSIKAQGYDFVARYLSQSHWKAVGPNEASAVASVGLALVLVYEDCPTCSSYFSFGRGQADGLRAAQQASLIRAPSNTVLYFAVDYDADSNDISGAIKDYFNGVAGALRSYAAANQTTYRTGVYGSGTTCGEITGAGLARCGWLAQSTGWRGHDTYHAWSIRQWLPAVIAGLSVDPDDAIADFGAIMPSAFLASSSPRSASDPVGAVATAAAAGNTEMSKPIQPGQIGGPHHEE
jgi:hypothetical protein